MNAELDQQLNDLIVRANGAIEKMEDKRKPGTQMMTKIAKIFTGLENDIENQKIIAQGHRNGWAKTCAQKEKEKTAAILKQQNIDKERIELKAKINQQIREAYQNKLLEFKTFYTNKLNSATLETLDVVTKTLNEIRVTYPRDKFYELAVEVSAVYMDKADLAPLIYDTKVELYDELAANFRENMEDHQQRLVEQLPSKKAELERIQKAGAEQKAQLEAAVKQRQLDDQKRLQEQAELAKQKDAQNVKMQQTIATSTNLFDTHAQIADVKQENTAKARQGYKIDVLSAAGWGAIFLFWFENEGQKMHPSAMGKKTLDQMKAFCEKHAHKTNEKIDHVHVIYEEEFKAVNTKAA
jgi:hypothetical protein